MVNKKRQLRLPFFVDCNQTPGAQIGLALATLVNDKGEVQSGYAALFGS